MKTAYRLGLALVASVAAATIAVAQDKPAPSAIHDEAKDLWGAALPFIFKVDDEPLAKPHPVGLIYDGVAAQ